MALGASGIGADVRRAAEAEGVAPDGPLGRLVSALADLGDRMEAAAAEAKTAVERRIAALDLAREGAEAAAEAARLAVADHKMRSDRALAELVDNLRAEVGAGLKDVLVIKQRIVGAQRIGLVAGLGALVAVVLLAAGAGLATWRDREAVRFHAACAREVVHDARGNAYCPMRGLLAEEGGR